MTTVATGTSGIPGSASALDVTFAAATWGVPGALFLGGYLVLVVAAAALVLRAPGRLDRTTAAPVDGLRAVDLAFLADGDRLAVTSALASLRTAELLDDDARTTPAGHLGAGVPGDAVQSAVLAVLGQVRDPRARRVADLVARPEVHRAMRGVEAGLRDRGLSRSAAEHTSARRWSLVVWVVVALGVARIVAVAVDGGSYGWLLLLTGLAAVVAAGTSIGGAVTANRAATATLERARADHRDLRSDLRPTWPEYRTVDVGLAVALFGWQVLTAAMPPLARAVAVHDVFDPHLGDSTVAG